MINNVVNISAQPAVKIRSNVGASDTVANTTARQATTNPAPSKTADAKQLTEAVSKLNDYVQNVQRNLSFSVDKDSGQTVVKVYDAQTNEVIRQIPSNEILKLAASIDKKLSHFLVKESV